MRSTRVFITYILLYLSFQLISSCRDYITDLGIGNQLKISTDKEVYGVYDTITVTLTNNSAHTVYVKEIFSFIERRNQDNWDTYLNTSCGNCIESSLTTGNSLYYKGELVPSSGTFRLVCLYSLTPGTAEQDKIKLYSNSFSVQ